MRVLIVDDDIVQVTLLSELVEIFEADNVSNGDEALVRFRHAHGMKRPYDLVFMDLNMPGFSGYDVVEAMRSEETKLGVKPTRIIVITGKEVEEGLTEQLKQQCDDYLVKPVNSDRILESLENLGLL